MGKKARIDKSVYRGGYEAMPYEDLGIFKKKASKRKHRNKNAALSTTRDIDIAIAEQRLRDGGGE